METSKTTKNLIFIPYQDMADFSSSKIMTREFSILKFFVDHGYKLNLNILKPRTLLDKKEIRPNTFAEGSYENEIYKNIAKSKTIDNVFNVNLKQLFKKRCWWVYGYKKMSKFIDADGIKDSLVYSNNPFAVDLLRFLHENGCKIYFDFMDNFFIHPSLRKTEQKCAYNCYLEILKFADFLSANSKQTLDFYQKFTKKNIYLVKNGVYPTKPIEIPEKINSLIEKKKKDFDNVAFYSGKLSKRVDADLLDCVTRHCEKTLFVICGPKLRSLENKLLDRIFEKPNIIYLGAINSEFIVPLAKESDILMIPHSTLKYENGGDPLKLYQYLLSQKPIITTGLIGVDEFEDIILISNNKNEWVNFINEEYKTVKKYKTPSSIFWENRLSELFGMIRLSDAETK